MDDLSAVRVLEVDDNPPWRRFVTAQLLESSVQLVGIAVDGMEAVDKARALQPDIVIMDIWLPGQNGLAASREIARLAPASRILIVTNEADPAIVKAAFTVGARGYLLKSWVGSQLLNAIAAIVRGDLFIGRGLTLCDTRRSSMTTIATRTTQGREGWLQPARRARVRGR